jgi:two-component system repressor protein LuxO
VVMNEGGMVMPDMLPEIVADEGGFTPPAAALAPLTQEPALDALIGRPLAEIERIVIEATLARFDGSVPKAARVLELSPSTLYRKLEGWKG